MARPVLTPKRGRPPKPRPAFPGGFANCPTNSAQLGTVIRRYLPWLSNEETQALADLLIDEAGFYAAALDLHPRTQSKTNKVKVPLTVLLAGCKRAYSNVTGGKRQPRGVRGAIRQTPEQLIAAAIHKEVTGKPLVQDLKRQARRARKVVITP